MMSLLVRTSAFTLGLLFVYFELQSIPYDEVIWLNLAMSVVLGTLTWLWAVGEQDDYIAVRTNAKQTESGTACEQSKGVPL